MAESTGICLSLSRRLGSPRQVLVGALLLPCTRLPSGCILTGSGGEALLSLLTRALMPSQEAILWQLCLNLITPPKPHLLVSSPWGLRVQHRDLGAHKHSGRNSSFDKGNNSRKGKKWTDERSILDVWKTELADELRTQFWGWLSIVWLE